MDGLLTIATLELWRTRRDQTVGGRWVAWLAFCFGIGMSLCANVASAPDMSVLAVIVAACPPLALLLAVELLNGALQRHQEPERQGGTSDAEDPPLAPLPPSREQHTLSAEQRMRQHYERERTKGRTPTGAELDRIAGTNNYGRKVLRRWNESETSTAAASC